MSAVEVKGLERRFGYTRVLALLDLEVQQGQHVTITGPNGSGKTTLLRVLAGLLRPDAGQVRVLGGSPSNPATRRRIGFLGHASSLYPRMTPAENLRFWGRLYDDRHAPDRGLEILAALGLDPADRRPVSAYSQGMRQRVSVARALCTGPELVIADEPLAALDEHGATTVAHKLGEGRTLVAATHDADRFRSTRRMVLRDGRLEELGA